MDTPSLPLQRALEQQRIALLEERVVRLERALGHLLREPAIAKPVPPRAVGAPAQQRLLLDTQSIRPDAAALRPAAAPPVPVPATQTTKPAPAKSPSAGGINLALTAAFETLDCSLYAAEDAEARSRDGRHGKSAAEPTLELNPELLDTARMRGIGGTLTVKSALEEFHPSLLRQLIGVWGSPEALPALRRLLSQDRGGNLGIEAGARQEITLLCGVLERFQLAARGA